MGLLGSLHFFKDSRGQNVTPLYILTPHGDNIRQEIGAAFTAWSLTHFGSAPELNWVDQGGTSEDLRYVESRFAKTPASIGIDLFFGGGSTPFRALAKEGLLAKKLLPEKILANVPRTIGGIPIYSLEEGWYGVALSSYGILFNRIILKEKNLDEPRSWADLAKPNADQWVASVDPRGSGSAHVTYEIILQKFGWEKGWEILTRMAANSNHFTKGASGVLPLVSTGETAYTVAIDLYAWSLIEKLGSERVGFILPPGETVVTPDPVAILKGAPHPEEAERFIEFLLSEQCQLIWSLKAGAPGGPAKLSLNRLSVLPAVYAHLDTSLSVVRGNPFEDAAKMDWVYSDSLTETRWPLLNDALGIWMVDYHEAARKALQTLAAGKDSSSAGLEQARAEKFFRPPAGWEEIKGYAARWKDDAFRNETMAKWARELNQ